MNRPRPHVPGETNAAVDQDQAPQKIDDAAQPGVPKSLRNLKELARSKAAKTKLDVMAYQRTDSDGGHDGGGR
jgi:hypothetical protein